MWSLIITADASSRWAARSAGAISVEKTLAWNANGRALATLDRVVEVVEAVDAGHGAEDLQLRDLGVRWRLDQHGRRQASSRTDVRRRSATPRAAAASSIHDITRLPLAGGSAGRPPSPARQRIADPKRRHPRRQAARRSGP